MRWYKAHKAAELDKDKIELLKKKLNLKMKLIEGYQLEIKNIKQKIKNSNSKNLI